MSTDDDRWTAETEELVAGGIHRGSRQCVLNLDECLAEGSHRREVHEVLTALADAGALLPPDVEPNRQYGRRTQNGRVIPSNLPDPTHYRINGPWVAVSET